MEQFIVDNLSTILAVGGALVTSLLIPLMLHYFKDTFDKSKRIIIEGNEIKNINHATGFPEQVFNHNNYFSNYFLNTVSITNKSTISQSVTGIELYEISTTDLFVEDIQFDGGFHQKQQKFTLLSYNNGNKKSKSTNYRIKYSFRDEETLLNKGSIIETLNVDSMNSGEVICLWVKDFKEFLDIFESDPSLIGVEITLLNADYEEVRFLRIFVVYSRELKQFGMQLGSGPGQEPPTYPLLDLTEGDKNKSISITEKLTSGSNSLDFSILLAKTCKLRYKIALISGNKKITNKQEYSLEVRVPIYDQEFGHFLGKFYIFWQEVNPDLNPTRKYSKEQIKAYNEELLFDMFRAPQKFSNYKK
ncbi:TPA: hypothetical protein ACGO35_000749 [Streptococcus suis]|nr:hypothetical protein [Streptococcus suis]